jgi:two-component SAPR family response regulator/LysM repeat protein
VLLGLTGAALYATAGPPRLPGEVPDVQTWLTTLRGTSIPLAGLGYILTTLAWLIWAWLSLSLVVRLAVAAADVVTHGAAWVVSLRRLTDSFTLPLVRRAVDSALAVAMVVQVVAHAAPAAAAELPAEPPAIVEVVGATSVVAPREAARLARYTVQPRDTIWTISERFYGTGHEFPRLVEANAGREMVDGAIFPETGVIEPGWVLRVPLPSTALDEQDGEVVYTVERGDTLWGISARFLGDPLRWPEIYEQNRGAALVDGRTLRDPNLIWPELRLRLPMTVEAVEAPVEVAAGPAVETVVQAPLEPERTAHVEVPPAESDNAMTMMGAAGGMAAAGATIGALLVRRRGRRGLDEPPIGDEPESDFLVRGGFAELTDLTRVREAPAHVAAAETLRYLAERGLEGRVGVVSTRHGRSGTTVALVSQQLADRPRIVEAAAGLSARLGVPVRSQVSRDHDVVVRLGPMAGARFAEASTTARLLPLGVLPDRRVLSVSWPALGHVLVAGHARGAVSKLLGTLVVNLAIPSRPESLQLITLARENVLSASLHRLPHQVGSPIDPADRLATTAALHDVRAELVRRMERVERGGSVDTLPELVLVAPELDGLLEHLSTLEMLGAYGPAHRLRLLAASTHSRELPDRLVAHFATRAVVRLPDDAESTRLLGIAAAVDLLGGGQLLLRLDEREPVEVYGFRLAEVELDRAVRVLRGDPPRTTPPAAEQSLEDEDVDDVEDEPRATPREVLPLGGRPGGPLIEVRCLGGFDVLAGPDDLTAARSPDEAAQRAGAWELLAFLSSQPEGLAAREDVLTALWPALEARVATRPLHAVLDQLNALLQPGLGHLDALPAVFLDDRDGTCRIDVARVESDVHRFIRLCRVAPLMAPDQALDTWSRARELYRGDLFDGPGGRAYAWALAPGDEGELSLRERLREQFYRATLRHARLLVRAGEPRAAIPLLRALLDVEPLLEDVVRDLYRCYGALGDLDGLVREDERLRRALVRAVGPDDDPDPEPATVALFARVREDLEVRATVPA